MLAVTTLFLFVLAIKVNAHSGNCSSQWNSCTSPCTINIGIKGTAWYDDCMNQCSNQELECETALAKTATSCFDQWGHCSSPCNTSIGVWGVSWYEGCTDFCEKQQTACKNQTDSTPVNTQPTTQSTGCAAGDWDLNGKCLSKDEWCNTTYGNSHEENGKCPCNAGYSFLNGACVSEDEVCRANSANASVKNGQCSCDAGYGELNNKCVTIEQWCQATYGADSHAENGSCVSASQQVKIPTQPSTRPALKPIININKTQTPPVKKPPVQPVKKTSKTKQLSVQEIQAITVYLFGAMGYDADDFDRAMETIDEIFKAARGLPSRKELNERALVKRKDADKEFIEAARDGRIKNAETRERIRKMYLDSWLDNPQDKKADMMMAIFEKDKGNNDTADVFEKFAYMSLSQKERNTLTTAVDMARESMGEKLMREKVNRTLLQKQLDNSAVMNQLKQNVNGEIAKAKETAKDVCYGNSACDWAWTKKVGIITEAQKLSQNVRNLMDDPIKIIFGIDRKNLWD